MGLRMTLRFRIISIVCLFAIILIAVFTALLITKQLRVITANNQYRARIGTFAAKGAFERALLSQIRTGDPPKTFQKLIPILQQGQLAENVLVSDLKAQVVASSSELEIGRILNSDQRLMAEYACLNYGPQTWFQTRVDPDRITFYTPITLDDAPRYVLILEYSLGNMRDAIQQVSKTCLLMAAGVIAAFILLCLLLIQAILGPIQILNQATQDIAAGNLGLKVSVPTEDELGELAETFNNMTGALLKMKERAENANPLTKLPGNNIIHEEIEKRLRTGAKFVAVYADLDNFKAFNDKYGIGAGDQAIKITAKIMREAVKLGSKGDFLGHEGGDDFFLLTTPEKVEEVAGYLCSEFDRQIKELYSAEDRGQGYIVSKDREGNEKRFPIMTISLAGVTNMRRKLTSYAEITNICAEVKKKVKNLTKEGGKSTFYLDRRTGEERNPAESSNPSNPETHNS